MAGLALTRKRRDQKHRQSSSTVSLNRTSLHREGLEEWRFHLLYPKPSSNTLPWQRMLMQTPRARIRFAIAQTDYLDPR